MIKGGGNIGEDGIDVISKYLSLSKLSFSFSISESFFLIFTLFTLLCLLFPNKLFRFFILAVGLFTLELVLFMFILSVLSFCL